MKRRFTGKRVLAGLAAGAIVLTLAATGSADTIEVSAAPRVMGDGNVFDPELYASLYPDVAAVYGTDAKALYQHYLTAGQQEGRVAYDPNTVTDTSLLPREEPDYSLIYATIINDFTKAATQLTTPFDIDAYEKSLGNKYTTVSYADGYFLYDINSDGVQELFLTKNVKGEERITDIFKYVEGQGAKEVPASYQIAIQVTAPGNSNSSVRNLSAAQYVSAAGDKFYGVLLTADNLLELHHKAGYDYYQLDPVAMTVTQVGERSAKRAHPLAQVSVTRIR